MGNIASVALIMALCDIRFSAFQYALLSTLALLPRYALGGPAGWLADNAGWDAYYVVSFVIGLPGIAWSGFCASPSRRWISNAEARHGKGASYSNRSMPSSPLARRSRSPS